MKAPRRARSLAVVLLLAAGGIGLISSTQTWVSVLRADAGEPLEVAGAAAIPLLAPLSLALLALGAALSIVPRVVRYLFAVLAGAGAAVLIIATAPLVASPPLSAVGPAVTEATGLSGEQALHDIVDHLAPSAWPIVALCCWALVVLVMVFVLLTAHDWQAGGRRYAAGTETHARRSGPLDAIDSWDELSHGTDPTD